MPGEWTQAMRPIFAAVMAIFLVACSDPAPPQGVWEGTYEADDVLIIARLAIAADGSARVTAPNAFRNYAAMQPFERELVRNELRAELDRSWPHVQPVRFDFDGKVFRKPGGVAPQLEWDDPKKVMTMIFYAGTSPTIRVQMASAEN